MTARKDFILASYGGGHTLDYNTDFWDTMLQYWADMAKSDVTAWSNIPTSAKMLAKIATGRFRVDEYGGTAWSTGGELLALNGSIIPEARSQFAMDWPALTFSVSSGAMTCNLKTALGADATAILPITVPFRSGTLTIGQTYARQLTAAQSLVIPSSATLGSTSATDQWLYFYELDYNTGTLELAVTATNQGNFLIGSTTAISGSATSASVIYSTTARTSVPMTLIGQVRHNQSAAGTWAATPLENRAGQQILGVQSGGTGVTTSTGSGSVVLSASPTGTGTWVLPTISVGAGGITNSGRDLAADGTISLPSISFSSDPDTGFYKSAAGSLNVTADGVACGTFTNGSSLATFLCFSAVTNNRTVQFINSAGSPGACQIEQLDFTNAAPNNTTSSFLKAADSSATRALIYSNGGLANFSANNVNLSDARLKNDIHPAPSYYKVFQQVEFVTYRLNDQTDDARNLGVIAQQLRDVAPELVSEAEGFDGMLGVYQTDFQYATARALQETIAKLEDALTRLSKLEGK